MAVSALGRFCLWLEQTETSQFIQKAGWVVPSVQTVHILAISAIAGSALIFNLRLLGVLCTGQSLQSVSRRFAPVIWLSLPVLLATGTILTIGEPARELLNPVFGIKMVLILTAISLLAFFQRRLSRDPCRYDGASGRGAALSIALPSLLLWTCIVIAGRLIAYV
jgi:putative copper export protein